jgi:flavodoxin
MASASVLEGNKRVLICWYTRTGWTKRVVDIVQARIHADLYQIEGELDYAGCCGLTKSICRLMCQTSERVVSRLPDLGSYDVILIACPIWASKAPPVISTFLEACDFGGKPVIPLSTCGGNADGFLDDFAHHVKTGRFVAKEGFYDVNNQTDEALAQKVTEWLQGFSPEDLA